MRGLKSLLAVVTVAAVLVSASPAAADVYTGSVDANGTSWRKHLVDVPSPGTLMASLDWDNPSADLNLFLFDETGTLVEMAIGPGNKPEEISYFASNAGTWKYGVKAKTGSANYTLTVTVEPGTPSSLGDLVWLDENENGLQDGGEPGASGATVRLLGADGSELASTTTGADGSYGFSGLGPGTYSIKVEPPVGYALASQNVGADDSIDSDADASGKIGPFAVAAGVSDMTRDAGLVTTTSTVDTFGGTVDANGSSWRAHKFDVTQPGTITATLDWDNAAANLNLFLYNPSGTLVAMQTGTNKPERILYVADVAGQWKLGVKAKSGSATYTLTVEYPGSSGGGGGGGPATYDETFGFNGPAGLYAYGMDWDASDNTILVSDYWNYRVKRFTAAGQFQKVVSATKPAGELGGISAPYDIEADMFDPDPVKGADLWVADQGSSRIVEFTHDGVWKQTIGRGGGGSSASAPGHDYPVGCGGGSMKIPTHIYVHPDMGRIFVSDPRCRNVYAFSHTGDFLFGFNWQGWKNATGLSTPIPRGLAGDGNGLIYVAEHNSRSVVVFDESGNYLYKFPKQSDMNDPRGLDLDTTNGYVVVVGAYFNEVFQFDIATKTLRLKLSTTGGVAGGPPFDSIRFPAVDAQGNIYVGDTWGYRVWKFDKNGFPLSWSQGPQPPPNGGLNGPNGVAINPADGDVFIVDTFEQRVQRFDDASYCRSAGTCPGYVLQFGGREPAGVQSEGFGYPRGLAFGDGIVWVGDNNNAVLAFDPDGNFIHRFGSQGPSPGQFKGGVQGIRVPGDGKIYTTDLLNCRLQIWDEAASIASGNNTGTLLNYMGSCGSGTNQMQYPRGVAVAGTTVYVAETGNSRISVWDTSTKSATTIRPMCEGTRIKSPWGLTLSPDGQWLYVADVGNDRIVRSSLDGATCELVTTGADTPAGDMKTPHYLEFGPGGRLYVSDRDRHVYRFIISG